METAFSLLGDMLNNEWVLLIIKMAVGIGIVLGAVPMMVWMERKVSARIQLRRGPNRVGPFGLLQSIADSVKLMWKEDFFPRNTDKIIFLAAPIMAFLPGVISFGLIPIGTLGSASPLGAGGLLSVSNISMGLLVFLAISSVASYGIAFAGWASNNQFSLLGGIRASAQLISYEVVMVLAVISLVMMTGTLNLAEMVRVQDRSLLGFIPAWNILVQPFTFILFLIAAFAETNRAPFDLPEAEQELVGGYHTEYTGMRYAWFMLAEYAGLFTMCSLIVTLFLGGWTLPGLNSLQAPWWLMGMLSVGIFMTKVVAMIFFFMWVRWTLPRFRWDQLMRLGWTVLIPLALANILILAVAMELGFGSGLGR